MAAAAAAATARIYALLMSVLYRDVTRALLELWRLQSAFRLIASVLYDRAHSRRCRCAPQLPLSSIAGQTSCPVLADPNGRIFHTFPFQFSMWWEISDQRESIHQQVVALAPKAMCVTYARRRRTREP